MPETPPTPESPWSPKLQTPIAYQIRRWKSSPDSPSTLSLSTLPEEDDDEVENKDAQADQLSTPPNAQPPTFTEETPTPRMRFEPVLRSEAETARLQSILRKQEDSRFGIFWGDHLLHRTILGRHGNAIRNEGERRSRFESMPAGQGVGGLFGNTAESSQTALSQLQPQRSQSLPMSRSVEFSPLPSIRRSKMMRGNLPPGLDLSHLDLPQFEHIEYADSAAPDDRPDYEDSDTPITQSLHTPKLASADHRAAGCDPSPRSVRFAAPNDTPMTTPFHNTITPPQLYIPVMPSTPSVSSDRKGKRKASPPPSPPSPYLTSMDPHELELDTEEEDRIQLALHLSRMEARRRSGGGAGEPSSPELTESGHSETTGRDLMSAWSVSPEQQHLGPALDRKGKGRADARIRLLHTDDDTPQINLVAPTPETAYTPMFADALELSEPFHPSGSSSSSALLPPLSVGGSVHPQPTGSASDPDEAQSKQPPVRPSSPLSQHSISFLETPPKGATKRQRDSHNPPAHLLEFRRRASGQGVPGGWSYGGVESSRRVRPLGLHEEMDEPLIDYNEIDRDWTPSRSAPRPPILPIAIRAQRDDRVLARRIIDELRWAVEFVWTLLYAWLAFVTFGMIRR